MGLQSADVPIFAVLFLSFPFLYLSNLQNDFKLSFTVKVEI